jgi:hypothetical protein
MKRWLNWLINGSYPYKKRWWLVGGRFILSLWITIIALCGIVIAGIYIVDPASFSDPKPDIECQTVEYNGEVIDTCEYLYP